MRLNTMMFLRTVFYNGFLDIRTPPRQAGTEGVGCVEVMLCMEDTKGVRRKP